MTWRPEQQAFARYFPPANRISAISPLDQHRAKIELFVSRTDQRHMVIVFYLTCSANEFDFSDETRSPVAGEEAETITSVLRCFFSVELKINTSHRLTNGAMLLSKAIYVGRCFLSLSLPFSDQSIETWTSAQTIGGAFVDRTSIHIDVSSSVSSSRMSLDVHRIRMRRSDESQE